MFRVGEDDTDNYDSDECMLFGGTVDVTLDDSDEVYSSVSGGVVKASNDNAELAGKPISGQNVLLYEWDEDFDQNMYDMTPLYKTVTDNNGYYRFDKVVPGRYILYTGDPTFVNYMDYTQEVNVKVGSGEVCNELIRMVKWSDRGKNRVTGIIRDAVTGKGVPGLEVTVRTGRDETVETDSEGRYIFNTRVYAGNYTANVKDPSGKYAGTSFTIINSGKVKFGDQNAVVCKKMPDDRIHIVAGWGTNNRGYEGHVTYPYYKKSYVVDLDLWPGSQKFTYNNKLVAKVYGDAKSYNPPETFSIYDTSKSFDYCFFENTLSKDAPDPELKNQMVKIEVYQGSGEKAVGTYYMPYTDGYGVQVFHYDAETKSFRSICRTRKDAPEESSDSMPVGSPWSNGWEKTGIERIEE